MDCLHLKELGYEKFAKLVTTFLSKMGVSIIKGEHHHSIEPRTSTKSMLYPLAKLFEPALLNLALPLPPTNNPSVLLITSSPQALSYPYSSLLPLRSCAVSSLPPQVHWPPPSFPSTTFITNSSPVTVDTIHLPCTSTVHKLTSKVPFVQCSSPHMLSSLSFTTPSKQPLVPPPSLLSIYF